MLPGSKTSDVYYTDEALCRALDGTLIKGRIKSIPEDFIVVEQLAEPLTGTGEHLYLRVKKRNANTNWVASQIARCADIRTLDVGYAGRKDRHAVTRQWFSVPAELLPRFCKNNY